MQNIKRTYEMDSAIAPQRVVQLINSGKIANLPKITPHADTYDTSVTFESLLVTTAAPNSVPPKAYMLSDGRVLVHHVSGTYIRVTYFTISGTTLTEGSTLTCTTSYSISVGTSVLIDDTRLLITYTQNYNSAYHCFIAVLLISGSNMTLGTPIEYVTDTNTPPTLVKVNATTFLLLYHNYNSYLYCVEYTVSSVTITQSQVSTAIVNDASNHLFAEMFNGSVIVGYRYNSQLYCVVISLYLNTFKIETAVAFSNAITSTTVTELCISPLANGKFFIAYRGNNAYVYTGILEVDLLKFVPFTWKVLQTWPSFPTWHDAKTLIRISDCVVQLVYETYNTAPSYTLTSYVFRYDETTNQIFAGTRVDLNALANYFIGSLDVSASKKLLLYQLTSPINLKLQVVTPIVTAPAETRTGKALGVATDSVGTVFLKGLCAGFTGLTVGEKYYYNTYNGVVSTTSSGVFLGVATSPTEILIPNLILT